MVTKKESEMPIKEFLKSKVGEVEKEIENYIPRKATKNWIESALGKTIFELDLEAYTKGVNEPIWDLLDRGGKRFRPVMTCICSEAVGGNWEEALKLAPMVELIHNGCIEENSLVWMADGTPRKMKDVQVGDYVVSVDKHGRLKERRVSHKHNNGIKEVFTVKTNNRTLTATEEHPFLTVAKSQPVRYSIKKEFIQKLRQNLAGKGKTISSIVDELFAKHDFGMAKGAAKNSLCGYKGCFLPRELADYLVEEQGMNWDDFEEHKCLYEKAEVKFEWKRTKQLGEGDIVVVGKNVYEGEGILPDLPLIEKKIKDRYTVPTLMTKDLAQLCGFIVGDGHIAKDKVELCIPKGVDGREEYEALTDKIFEAESSKYKNSITCCSTALVQLFDYLGLKKNHLDIGIPHWVFKLPREYKIAFVKGYIASDGHIAKRGDIRLACANKLLMEQFKMLLDSIGFITGNVNEKIVSNEHFPNAIKKQTTLYTLSVNQAQTVLLYTQNVMNWNGVRSISLRQEEKVPSLPEQLSFDQLGFVEVREVIAEKELAQTYDIEVEETHSYIANGIAVHNTLMQDDVEDDSVARRGKACTHKIFGVDTAVNTGTIMFYWPLAKIMTDEFKLGKEKKLQIYDLYAKELLRVCSGQAWDIAWHHGGFTPNEKHYLNMCLSKTGVLTRFACQLGAIIGGATQKQYEALGDFGQIVGVGFQIQDDILELTETSFKEKKGSVGGDIHEGKRTLIIIRTLEKASSADKKRLIEILDSHTNEEKVILEALDIINKYDGIAYSKKTAEKLVEDAWKKVDKVLVENNAKIMLKKFAEYLVDRKI